MRRLFSTLRTALRAGVPLFTIVTVACGGRVLLDDEPPASTSPVHDASTIVAPPHDAAGPARDASADLISSDAVALDVTVPDAPSDAAVADDAEDSADALPDVVCDAGVPIPICVEYAVLASRCFGEDLMYLACEAIPSASVSLQYLEELCADNLQRLEQACQ